MWTQYRRSFFPQILLSTITLVVLTTASSSSQSWHNGAPWQVSNDDNLVGVSEQLRYNDLSPTIFSPTGRLHPVERAMETVREDARSNLVVALRCQDGIMMLSTIPLSPNLNTTATPTATPTARTEPTSTSTTTTIRPLRDESNQRSTSLFLIESAEEYNATTLPIVEIGSGVLAATAGRSGDEHVLRLRLQAMAAQQIEEDLDDQTATVISNGGVLALSRLARQIADQLQGPTQKTNARQGPLLASAAILAGTNDNGIWRIDPTGQFWRCHGAIIGRESNQAEEMIVTNLLQRNVSLSLTDGHAESEIEDEKPSSSSLAPSSSSPSPPQELKDVLQSMKCEEAIEIVQECLQELFWPVSLNLQLLPEGVRAHIPSIPWVAVTLLDRPGTNEEENQKSIDSSTSKSPLSRKNHQPCRIIRRGAFIPRIPSVNRDVPSEEGPISEDSVTPETR